MDACPHSHDVGVSQSARHDPNATLPGRDRGQAHLLRGSRLSALKTKSSKHPERELTRIRADRLHALGGKETIGKREPCGPPRIKSTALRQVLKRALGR